MESFLPFRLEHCILDLRRSLSIFFLVLFLLYQVGFLAYYWYSAEQINEQWLSLVEITPDMKHVTIPVALPYWNNQDEYQPTHGKININGKLYRKVFQKYYMNEIHLIIAEDLATAQLQRSVADWVRMMTDMPNNGKSSLLKSVTKEYICDEDVFLSEPPIVIEEKGLTSMYIASEGKVFAEKHTPPPQG